MRRSGLKSGSVHIRIQIYNIPLVILLVQSSVSKIYLFSPYPTVKNQGILLVELQSAKLFLQGAKINVFWSVVHLTRYISGGDGRTRPVINPAALFHKVPPPPRLIPPPPLPTTTKSHSFNTTLYINSMQLQHKYSRKTTFTQL
jgi:hypothetical protein